MHTELRANERPKMGPEAAVFKIILKGKKEKGLERWTDRKQHVCSKQGPAPRRCLGSPWFTHQVSAVTECHQP